MRTQFLRPRPLLYAALLAGLALALAGCPFGKSKPRPRPTSFATLDVFTAVVEPESPVRGMRIQMGDYESEPFGVAASGSMVYFSGGTLGVVFGVDLAGKREAFGSGFSTPSQLAVDDKGNVLVADSGSHTIKRLTPESKVEVIAGGDGRAGFADGDAKSGALFRAPVGIAFGDGRIFVADTYNDRIRVIDESGRVTTLAGAVRGYADGGGAQALFDTPCGLAYENGRLYVADTGNRRIRAVDVATGAVTTIAGNGGGDRVDGRPEEASFVQPVGIATEGAANGGGILITDGNAIRRISPARAATDKEPAVEAKVETFAGDRRGYVEGPLAEARFSRPSGISVDPATGRVFVADSDNRVIRVASADNFGVAMPDARKPVAESADRFRAAAPARWPYDPPSNKREIAGTLGEVRGEMKEGSDQVWFHNGLDVVGGYGETSRFVRDEKVLRPLAAENFGTLRELIRMPTMGYIHIRLGRDQTDKPFGDERFVFDRDAGGKIVNVRVPRGAAFKAGEPIGTLNAMNHTHLIAGPSGFEMNALAALELPGVSDKIAPVIEYVELYDQNWARLETAKPGARINLRGKTRIVVKAFDRMDGNADRRRLGIYETRWQVLTKDGLPATQEKTTIKFDRLPDPDAVFLVYANGSKSGATGETIFRYIATNEVHGDVAREEFLDAASLAPGDYTVRVTAADYFGNSVSKDVAITVLGR